MDAATECEEHLSASGDIWRCAVKESSVWDFVEVSTSIQARVMMHAGRLDVDARGLRCVWEVDKSTHVPFRWLGGEVNDQHVLLYMRVQHFFFTETYPQVRPQKSLYPKTEGEKDRPWAMASSCLDPAQLKWSAWNEVVHNAYDRPTHESVLARRVCVPLVVCLVTAAILVMIYPPFACTPAAGVQQPQLSIARVVCWSVLAGVAVAVLTSTHLFR